MKRWLVAILAALFFVGTGVAVASIPAADGTINGCYKNTNGSLRVIDSSETCDVNETPLDWNQEGSPGISGYEIKESTVTASQGQSVTSLSKQVICPTGKVPLGGGYRLGESPLNELDVIHNAPFPRPPVGESIGWLVVAINRPYGGQLGSGETLTTYVVCAEVES